MSFDALRKPIAIYISNKTKKRLRMTSVSSEGASLRADPWIFADEIVKTRGAPDTGRVATVYDAKGQLCGVGLYDASSEIAVRLLAQSANGHARYGRINLSTSFIKMQMQDAIVKREVIATQDTNAFRVINGEQDNCPGLIVDRYDAVHVVKLYSLIWCPHFDLIVGVLREAYAAEHIVLRLARNIKSEASRAGLSEGQYLFGPKRDLSAVEYKEDGLSFIADVINGQKTGAFLDQRENRFRLREMTAGQSVLNVFSYTGGFSLAAAAGGAKSVTSVDLSPHANAYAEHIFLLNQHHINVAQCVHQTITGDAFEVLENLRRKQKCFGVVIVDPPSFARRREHIDQALHAYERLASASLPLVEKGGVLIFASCTSRVSIEVLENCLNNGAKSVGRTIQVLGHYHHAKDHPHTTTKGGYLKCLKVRVS